MRKANTGEPTFESRPGGADGISRRRVLQGAAGAATMGVAGVQRAIAQDAATPEAAPTGSIHVYPIPGTRTASARTQLSFRGAGLTTLSPIQVDGSESGTHPGVQIPHSDGNGISWFPDFAFHPGEGVSVRTRLDIAGGNEGDFSFTCATPRDLSAFPQRNGEPDETEVHTYRSRPGISPTRVEAVAYEGETAPGYIFISPKRGDGRNGALIVDNAGEPVWFFPSEIPAEELYDFRVMEYEGEPALVWWQGVVVRGHGFGHWVIRNDAYEQIAVIRIGNGYQGGDLHDIVITPQNTALVGTYNTIQWDLTPIEGPEDGLAIDNIVQEIDIPTGAVMYEWHALDFLELDETHDGVNDEDPADPGLDHFHYNSVAVDQDGHLLLSGRNTWSICKVDRVTGEVIWKLGGKQSDFEMGAGAEPAYQHDARPWPNGELSLFDNGASPDVHEQSRGLFLALDTDEMAATVTREYLHPDKILAGSQGNMHVLPNGNVVIGWGSEPLVSEFADDGTLLLDLRLPEERQSYRAYRFEWTGRPTELPALAVESGAADEVTIYASWNGATELAAWQVLAGESEDDLAPVGDPAERTGFETTINVESDAAFFAVEALDVDEQSLGVSNARMRSS